MLFDTSLRKELARNFGATLVVILTIVLTIVLMRTVGDAASGVLSPEDVLLMLGYTAVGYLSPILALSLFVAIVHTLGRLWRDSEMVIWNGAGLGLMDFSRPVLRMAWPVLLLIAALMLLGWPWVNARTDELIQRYARRSDISRVAPGVFQTSRDGRSVFFIEKSSASDLSARNVFILTINQTQESVTTARSGIVRDLDDGRYLVLEAGQRIDEDLAAGVATRAYFQTAQVRLGDKEDGSKPVLQPRSQATLDLLAQRSKPGDAELSWRLGMVLAALNMSMLAIGLSVRDPRRPSSWNLLIALLSFVVYFNMLNLSRVWVLESSASLGQVLVLVHGPAALLALLLIVWTGRAQSWQLLPRATGPEPA